MPFGQAAGYRGRGRQVLILLFKVIHERVADLACDGIGCLLEA